jgi:hypothetical protein
LENLSDGKIALINKDSLPSGTYIYNDFVATTYE